MNIKISLNQNTYAIERILNEDPYIEVKKEVFKNRTIFNIKSSSKRYIEDVLYKIIIDVYLFEKIKERIFKEYTGFDFEEILNLVKENINNEGAFLIEKNRIKSEIKNHIEEFSLIYLDSFVIFRLKNLKDLSKDIIDSSIEGTINKHEYKMFIDSLEAISKRKSNHNSVTLIFVNDTYKLLDENGKEINKDYFKDISKNIGLGKISEKDLLIATLLALAPDNISIHNKEDEANLGKNTLTMIEDIFKNRVYYCYNCKNCIRKVGSSLE